MRSTPCHVLTKILIRLLFSTVSFGERESREKKRVKGRGEERKRGRKGYNYQVRHEGEARINAIFT